ncbi:hypothetical protein C8R46DRAFT_1312847, partial [Mycena filopes]
GLGLPPEHSAPKELGKFLASAPRSIYLDFVTAAALLECPPYQWQETRSAIILSSSPEEPYIQVELSLHRAILTQLEQLAELDVDVKNTRLEWFGKVTLELLSLWRPNPNNPRRIPKAVVYFFLRQNSQLSLHPDIYFRLWSCFPRTLSQGAQGFRPSLPPISTEHLLKAMWCVASGAPYSFYFDPSAPKPSHLSILESRLSILESAFKTLSNAEFSLVESQISHSLLAMLKIRIIAAIQPQISTVNEALVSIGHPLFPVETIVHIPDNFNIQNTERELASSEYRICYNFMAKKKSEAMFCVVVEYMEYCTSNIHTLPYKAHTTLNKIFNSLPPSSRVHPTHQFRFAESIRRIFEGGQSLKLEDAIINCAWWNLYAEGQKTEGEIEHRNPFWSAWLQDSPTRQITRAVFAQYEQNSGRSTNFRVRKILEGIDFWHPEDAVGDPSRVANANDTVAEEPRTVAENLEGSAVDSDPGPYGSSNIMQLKGAR